MAGLPFEPVRRAAVAILPTLLARWLPSGMARGKYWVSKRRKGDDFKSLVVWIRVGKWVHFSQDQKGGDPISLYAYLFGLGQGDACRELAAELGIEAGRPRPGRVGEAVPEAAEAREPPIDADKEGAERRRWAREIWAAAGPTAGTPVETYLAGRGITGSLPPTIRFARLAHPASGKDSRWPVMLTAMQVGRQVVGVHRTFLAPDGRGKLDILDQRGEPERPRDGKGRYSIDRRSGEARERPPRAQTKMMLGQAECAVARLSPTGPDLVLCEGIETGLSLVQVAPGWTVWAALSAGNLARVAIPAGTRQVIYFADGDRKDDLKTLGIRRTGLQAAEAAAKALDGLGISARVMLAPPGQDANDLLMTRSPLLAEIGGMMQGWKDGIAA
jgi:hypothetical protein